MINNEDSMTICRFDILGLSGYLDEKGIRMTNYLHQGDLPADIVFEGDIAVDSEAMCLHPGRDRLCVVQLSDGNGDAHLVQFAPGEYAAPNLKKLLADPNRTKIYHFARFDLAIIYHYLGIWAAPVYCTKIASKLVRTYSDKHGFKEICKELIGQDISKQQQSSDWGSALLTPEQVGYAAADVLYLHKLRDALNIRLEREGRTALAAKLFDFLPTRAELDLAGWPEVDIFAHS
jgi:ribonuclease D